MDVPRARALRKRGDTSQDLPTMYSCISDHFSVCFHSTFETILTVFFCSERKLAAQRLIDFKALKSGVAGVISKVAMATSDSKRRHVLTLFHTFSASCCILQCLDLLIK